MVKESIWKYKLNVHSEIKNELIDRIVRYGAKAGNFDKNSKTDTYSDYFIKDGHREYAECFLPHLEDFMTQLLDRTGCDNVNYFFWYQRYIQNGQHSWHNHPSCSLSSIYYVKLEDPKDATEFFDPSTRTTYQPDVEEGDIIVFPSYLPHRSKFIDSDREKIIISTNYNFFLHDKLNLGESAT